LLPILASSWVIAAVFEKTLGKFKKKIKKAKKNPPLSKRVLKLQLQLLE
jgi:hypothetical protein